MSSYTQMQSYITISSSPSNMIPSGLIEWFILNFCRRWQSSLPWDARWYQNKTVINPRIWLVTLYYVISCVIISFIPSLPLSWIEMNLLSLTRHWYSALHRNLSSTYLLRHITLHHITALSSLIQVRKSKFLLSYHYYLLLQILFIIWFEECCPMTLTVTF